MIVLSLFLSAATLQVMHNWELHTFDQLGFSIFAPKTLEYKSKDLPLGLEQSTTYHTYYYEPKGDTDKTAFTVSCYRQELPEEMISDVLDEIVLASVESVNGVLDYQDAIELDDQQGRLWRISVSEGNSIMKCKAFYKDDFVYILQVIAFKEEARESKVEAFLSSFRFLKQQ